MKKRNEQNTPGEMTFLDHLEELRWRLIKSALAVAAAAIPCGIYWRQILRIVMIHPLRFADPLPKLIYTGPAEAVMLSLKVALIGGIIAASPLIFFQIWSFIAPGLYKNEKKVILPAVFFSTMSFLGGLGFSYLALPYLFKFLAAFGGDLIDPYFKAPDYISFIMKISVSFGLVFELPVASYVLTKLGIIDHHFLLKYSKYFIVIAFIIAAILTPPDVISQTIMVVPLLLLYAASILVSFFTKQGEKK